MKIRWGVIGCGGIADRRTIPGMMLSENAELVAVMDANPTAANNVKEKYNAKYAFDSIDDLLAVDEIDAVYIATPVFLHKEQVEKAAKAKKHILIEKPVGLNVSDAEEIVKICEENGVKLGVGFMMRFHTYHQKMKELIANGEIGEIVSARAQFTCWYPEMQNAWRQVKAFSGGGAMIDMAIHCVDLIRYITGKEVCEVASMTGNTIFKYEVEDSGTILFRLENGAICCVESNFNIPDDAAVCRIEFYGSRGTIYAEGTLSQEEHGSFHIRRCADTGYDAAQKRTDSGDETITLELGNMYEKEITYFGEAIAMDKEVPITAEDAIKTQKVIEAAYSSESLKKHIKL